MADAFADRDIPLGFHWHTLDYERIHALGVPHHRDRDRNRARNSILTEAVLAHEEGRWVSYSRRQGFYTDLRRYHGTAYTYATIMAAIDELLGLGLIEEERSQKGQRGHQSRFRATQRLVEDLAEALFEYELHGLIRLKNAAGDLMGFNDTHTTRRLHREVEEVNAFLTTIDLQLDASDVVRTHRHLIVDGAHYRLMAPADYRVFNRGSFSFGGRAYGWWQNLPKARRHQLLIGGEPVAEPDFAQMHASILYGERGLRLEGDAYETGLHPHNDNKIAFNVALNARSLQGTISALVQKTDWPHSARETGRLVQALKDRHAPIADALHADQGIRLMRLDSEIALTALQRCIKADIPALPVHDSFVTARRNEGRVAEFMEEGAAGVLRLVKPCTVRRSGENMLHMPSPPFPPSSFPSSSSLPSVESAPNLGGQLELFAPPAEPGLGEQMRELRERLGLSQRALGARLGLLQPHVANVERGHDRLGEWPRRRLQDLDRPLLGGPGLMLVHGRSLRYG